MNYPIRYGHTKWYKIPTNMKGNLLQRVGMPKRWRGTKNSARFAPKNVVWRLRPNTMLDNAHPPTHPNTVGKHGQACGKQTMLQACMCLLIWGTKDLFGQIFQKFVRINLLYLKSTSMCMLEACACLMPCYAGVLLLDLSLHSKSRRGRHL